MPTWPGVVDRAVIAFNLHVITSRFGVKLHPIGNNRAADQDHLVGLQAERDRVANNLAIIIAGQYLLRFIPSETLEAVDRDIRQQPDDVGAF